MLLGSAALALLAGCPQYASWDVPNPIRSVPDPTSNKDYYFYAPTRYHADTPVPLVILCHGTEPWDTPLREIRDWVKLAEEKNFLVAAPHLKGTRGDLPPGAARQIELQKADERTILACLRHVRGAYAVDETRVFLAGWSAGGYAVLYTGLSHPELFRALAVMQGNFNPVYLSDVVDRIDPYQPVYVIHGTADVLTGASGEDCIKWLYDHNAYVVDGRVPGPHRAHPRAAHDFFEKTLRESPWAHISAQRPDDADPLEAQFKLRSSFEPGTYTWEFGDGETSPVASPRHRYAAPREYVVKCTVTTQRGKRVRRQVTITVPLANAPTALQN
jgi:predicted esterase